MIIIEFFGGPGSGKSTGATTLYSKFKQQSIECEFVREYAQELIFKGRQHLLLGQNQFAISAGQYTKYKELERCGVPLVFSDSSLLLCKVFANETPLNQKLCELIDVAQAEFEVIKVFVERVKPYITLGRLQTENQAKVLDTKILQACGPFDYTISGSEAGYELLFTKLQERFQYGE